MIFQNLRSTNIDQRKNKYIKETHREKKPFAILWIHHNFTIRIRLERNGADVT